MAMDRRQKLKSPTREDALLFPYNSNSYIIKHLKSIFVGQTLCTQLVYARFVVVAIADVGFLFLCYTALCSRVPCNSFTKDV